MTDSELLLAIYNDVKSLKDDLEIVRQDVKHLKKEAIKMQAMDEAILDEVERVHLIPASNEPSAVLARAFGECREGQQPRCSAAGLLTLDKHKADRTAHTA